MKKNATIRLVISSILLALIVSGSIFSFYILKDFIFGEIEGMEGLAGLVVFPLAIIVTGIIIILTIFNILLLGFSINSYKKSEQNTLERKRNLVGIIIETTGIIIAIIHIILMLH